MHTTYMSHTPGMYDGIYYIYILYIICIHTRSTCWLLVFFVRENIAHVNIPQPHICYRVLAKFSSVTNFASFPSAAAAANALRHWSIF